MTELVSLRREGAVHVLSIDSPPVNALSQALRRELLGAFAALRADPSVDAVLVTCAGSTFVSGADLKEFDTGLGEPGYHEVFHVIESFERPVVAALFGTALGAGVELAMACHYRCAAAGARLGFPEVSLGIIPGAGGTQRLPRLVGARTAVELVLSAAPIDAERAHKIGLVDAVIEGELLPGALAYVRQLVAEGAGSRPTAARMVDTSGFDTRFVDDALANAARKWRGQQAPRRAVEAIRVAAQLPVPDGVLHERAIAREAERSVESRALRHLFFAEREAARIPGLTADGRSREIGSAAIVGAGTMGRGIAVAFADAGIHVRLVDIREDTLASGLEAVRATYRSSVAKGRLSRDEADGRLASIVGATDMDAVSDVDLVVEAVFEHLPLKETLFRQFDRLCRPGAILATNTSTLDVDAIAAVTSRPESVVGLHFFSPANVMRLLEIVRGARTSGQTLATAIALAKRLRKIGVVVGVCYGFVGNRMMLEGYVREADQLLLEGATPRQIDRVLERFGFAMGPCAMNDMAGNDVALRSRESPGAREGKPRPYHEVIDALARGGLLGQKSGAGFYRYLEGDRTPRDNPESTRMIEQLAAELGVRRRTIGDEEIETRCVYSLINEGARILEEGIACRAGDIDVVWTSGYGFPRFRGGPMFHADVLGPRAVYERIRDLHREHGHYWRPAALLEQLAHRGESFAQLQPG